ncbi:hypothetical protein CHS0354_002477 [Potamilus streckersoni]|uniref:RING-type domain-containing protein n=1 Tax=Potamilus streckersoni TaxID=2493646 RepID=A0AAE0T9I4_9BIVA|nr:hypothetical protein CHS0354_002477 [Potamilus streckersoni]
MDTDPLFALLEVMLNSFASNRVKPGGHSEDIFLDLTEDEKEELECSICYNILKETRECSNKHRFCYSCIFVWSTSGNPINHGRCPMCRADGYYVRNKAVDEIINQKRVKCSMENCNWTGPLKELGSHKHNIYTTPKKIKPTQESVTELPSLNKQSRTSRTSARTSQLPNSSYRSTQKASQSSRQNGGSTRINAVSSTRSTNNSNSPQRHRNLSNRRSSRLLSRGQISQDHVLSESRHRGQSPEEEPSVATPRTPRPPSSPRPANLPNQRRRVTTLPSLIQTDNNNNQSSPNNDGDGDTIRARVIFTTPREGSIPPREVQFVSIRDRLVESRNRLDNLMGAFTVELERGRREISEFQEERERRRQEQLEEVRDLGRRLGNVATELRRLLNQRRLRNTLDELVTADDDDDDDD